MEHVGTDGLHAGEVEAVRLGQLVQAQRTDSGAAFGAQPGAVIFQTIEGPDTSFRWSEICQTK